MGFDIFVLVILLITTFRGAAKGVAWQLAGIGALVLCFMFATPLSLSLAPLIKLAPPLNRWVAMLAIYLVFSFGTFAVARGFREALEKAKFVEFDRHLGALFGLAKGIVIALVITFFAVAMSQSARDYILKTHTGFAAAHIMEALRPVMPRELHDILEPYIHQLDAIDPRLGRHDDEEELIDETSELSPQSEGQGRGNGYQPIPRPGRKESSRDPFFEEPSETEKYAPPGETPSPPDVTENQEPQSILDTIPALARQLAPAVKNEVMKVFENTLAEHRDQFLEELSQATPDAVLDLARSWRKGTPPQKRLNTPPENFEDLDPEQMNSEDFAPQVPLTKPNTPGRNRPDSSSNLTNRPTIRKPVIGDDDFRDNPLDAQTNKDWSAHRQKLLQDIARIFTSSPSLQAKKMTEIDTLVLGLPDPVVAGVLEDWLSDLRGDEVDPDSHTDVTSKLDIRIARQLERLGIKREDLSQDWQTRLERFLRN